MSAPSRAMRCTAQIHSLHQAVAPGTTGDIPQIIANDEGLYEGNLISYFQILFFESRNLQNPYHNLRHILHVTWLCYQAADFYRQKLSPRQIRNLLVAALFHDFDHPGHSRPGEDSDHLNIEIAIAALRRHLQPVDRAALPEIETLIRVTEFPYKPSARSLDLSGKIIRDADRAQVLNPAWIQQIVIGLAEEAGVAPLAMLRAQRSFLDALVFETRWARELFPPHLVAAKIAEAEALVRLLETRERRVARSARRVPADRIHPTKCIYRRRTSDGAAR